MVSYIYIDESGDLGLRGSRYFIIVAVICNDPKELGRIIKKLRQRKLKKHIKNLPEIKANNSRREIREYVLRKFRNLDVSTYALIVDKSKILPRLYDVKNRLYNYFAGILIDDLEHEKEVSIVIDKKDTNALIRRDFNSYIKRKITKKRYNIKIEIKHIPSINSNELQVVDFIAWAVFRNFDRGDSYYFDMIKDKIKIKELWNDK